jgi:plasmid stability protein
MSKMIQVRNVPDDVHRTLKARAAHRGMSLSDYLNAELRRIAETPTFEELVERIGRRAPVTPDEDPVVTIRRARDNA